MKRIFMCVLGCGLLWFAACAPAPMTTDGYDKTCSADTDCTVVFVGPVCGCSCSADAIAKTEESRYSTEYSNRQSGCSNLPSCAPCPSVTATCSNGKCAVPN
ncbi:MAG: hypothetical protein H6728_02360 [Myxococcales bacterium]|nr:hypothetical protein [Myxococcales bacterium]MCB9641897.1 hypothetical protein [Myxococcales bacterium]